MYCTWCQKFLKNAVITHIINVVSRSDIFSLLQCLHVCLCIPYFLGVNTIANNKPSVKRDSSPQRSQCICFCSLATQSNLLDTGNLCMLTVYMSPSLLIQLQPPKASRVTTRACMCESVCECVSVRVATAPLSCPFLQALQCIYRCCILSALSNK